MSEDQPVIEVTEFTVDPSNHAAFAAAMGDALPILTRQAGASTVDFGSVVEPSEGFFLLVRWRKLADHQTFRQSSDFDLFVGGFRPLLKTKSRVLHVATITRAASA